MVVTVRANAPTNETHSINDRWRVILMRTPKVRAILLSFQGSRGWEAPELALRPQA